MPNLEETTHTLKQATVRVSGTEFSAMRASWWLTAVVQRGQVSLRLCALSQDIQWVCGRSSIRTLKWWWQTPFGGCRCFMAWIWNLPRQAHILNVQSWAYCAIFKTVGGKPWLAEVARGDECFWFLPAFCCLVHSLRKSLNAFHGPGPQTEPLCPASSPL